MQVALLRRLGPLLLTMVAQPPRPALEVGASQSLAAFTPSPPRWLHNVVTPVAHKVAVANLKYDSGKSRSRGWKLGLQFNIGIIELLCCFVISWLNLHHNVCTLQPGCWGETALQHLALQVSSTDPSCMQQCLALDYNRASGGREETGSRSLPGLC